MFTSVRALFTLPISIVDPPFGTSTKYFAIDNTTIRKRERFEVIPGIRNSLVIRDQSGFQFRKGCYSDQTRKTTWYCSKRSATKCRTKVVTEGEFIVLQKCQHNHE